MRIVLQRVQMARVDVGEKTVAQVGAGLLLLVGVTHDDTEADAQYLAEKSVNLRIFEDDAGKMNVSGLDAGAEILAISQFTLYADTRRGRRPSFIEAAPPEQSLPLFNRFVEMLKDSGLKVMAGEFGSAMSVDFINDGPVTIILDSRDKS